MTPGLPGDVMTIAGERLRVAVSHRNGEAPPVLFLNGMGMPLDYWDPVVYSLTDYPCARFDRPGLGGSPLSAHSSANLRDEVDRALAVANWFLGDQRFVAVGHSFGGVIAEAMSRLHPELISGLVLVDSTDPAEYASEPEVGTPFVAKAFVTMTSVPQIAALTGSAIERALTFNATVRRKAPKLTEAQHRLLRTPTHLATIVAEDARIPRQCRQAVGLFDNQPMPDIPVHLLVGGESGGLFQRRQQGWIKRNQSRLASGEFGPRSRMKVLRSAHLMMFDVPEAIATAIRRAAAGQPE